MFEGCGACYYTRLPLTSTVIFLSFYESFYEGIIKNKSMKSLPQITFLSLTHVASFSLFLMFSCLFSGLFYTE